MSRAGRGSETQPPHHAQNRRASGTPEQCYVSTTFMLTMVYTFAVFAFAVVCFRGRDGVCNRIIRSSIHKSKIIHPHWYDCSPCSNPICFPTKKFLSRA